MVIYLKKFKIYLIFSDGGPDAALQETLPKTRGNNRVTVPAHFSKLFPQIDTVPAQNSEKKVTITAHSRLIPGCPGPPPPGNQLTGALPKYRERSIRHLEPPTTLTFSKQTQSLIRIIFAVKC